MNKKNERVGDGYFHESKFHESKSRLS